MKISENKVKKREKSETIETMKKWKSETSKKKWNKSTKKWKKVQKKWKKVKKQWRGNNNSRISIRWSAVPNAPLLNFRCCFQSKWGSGPGEADDLWFHTGWFLFLRFSVSPFLGEPEKRRNAETKITLCGTIGHLPLRGRCPKRGGKGVGGGGVKSHSNNTSPRPKPSYNIGIYFIQ